jgi:hypothetical protein
MTEDRKQKFLFSGLGGGLDIVNAYILRSVANSESKESLLGSCRPPPRTLLENVEKFSESGCLINKTSIIPSKNPTTSRYVEPRICEILDEKILFFSRNVETENKEKWNFSAKDLNDSIRIAIEKFQISHVFFVDGGGDALVLESSDTNEGSETIDPFKGGDAQLMQGAEGIPNIFQISVCVGLDIDLAAFQKNVKLLKEIGGYFGRVNLFTGEKDNYQLDHLLSFNSKDFLNDYFKLADQVLVINEDQLKEYPKRMMR